MTTDPTLLSLGKRTYRANHNWAQLPESVKPGYTHGIVEDRKGRLYITNQSPHAVLVLDAEGRYLSSWGAEYASGAHGLTIQGESEGEFLYLANTSMAEVVKTTLEGEVVWKIGTPPVASIYSDEKKFSPTETAVAPDGTVYVTDGYGQSCVHIYDREGRYLSTFGSPGAEPGQLKEPHGICVDTRKGQMSLLVANRANRRIDRFSLSGVFQETIIGPENLRYPCTMVPWGDELYIPDLFARLSVFDGDNCLIGHLGDYIEGREWKRGWDAIAELDPGLAGYPNIAQKNRLPGKFSSPHGLHVDRSGNIFVVEWISDGRITKLTRLPQT